MKVEGTALVPSEILRGEEKIIIANIQHPLMLNDLRGGQPDGRREIREYIVQVWGGGVNVRSWNSEENQK